MEYQNEITKDKFCNWNGLINVQVADLLLEELKKQLELYKDKNIILMSHIVPYKDYVIFKDNKSWDYWNAFFGNVCIGHYADLYKTKFVQFGHTHKRFNAFRDKKRIICSPLGYSFEWETQNIEKELRKCIRLYNF